MENVGLDEHRLYPRYSADELRKLDPTKLSGEARRGYIIGKSLASRAKFRQQLAQDRAIQNAALFTKFEYQDEAGRNLAFGRVSAVQPLARDPHNPDIHVYTDTIMEVGNPMLMGAGHNIRHYTMLNPSNLRENFLYHNDPNDSPIDQIPQFASRIQSSDQLFQSRDLPRDFSASAGSKFLERHSHT